MSIKIIKVPSLHLEMFIDNFQKSGVVRGEGPSGNHSFKKKKQDTKAVQGRSLFKNHDDKSKSDL